MQPIKLMLTVEEINRIFNAMGQVPYASIADLFDKIRSQASPQIAAMQALEEAEVKQEQSAAPNVAPKNGKSKKETVQ